MADHVAATYAPETVKSERSGEVAEKEWSLWGGFYPSRDSVRVLATRENGHSNTCSTGVAPVKGSKTNSMLSNCDTERFCKS